MKVLVEATKIFLENHFIRTLVAIASTITIYLIIPDNYYLYEKLGLWGFNLFVFVLSFLFVVVIQNIFNFIRRKSIRRANKKYQQRKMERNIKEQLEQLWLYVDELSNNDFKLLERFLETGNKPIERDANTYYSSGSLLSSQYVHSTIVENPKIETKNNDEKIEVNYDKISMELFNPSKKLYVLNDSFYQLLKHSKEKYGKISHFR